MPSPLVFWQTIDNDSKLGYRIVNAITCPRQCGDITLCGWRSIQHSYIHMKKTLTLAALAVAFAVSASADVTTWDAASLAAAEGTLTIPSSGSFTLTVVLDAAQAKDAFTSPYDWANFISIQGTKEVVDTETGDTTTQTKYLNLSYNGWTSGSNAGKGGIFASQNANSATTTANTALNTDFSKSLRTGLAAGTYTSIALTMVHSVETGSMGSSFYFTGLKADGSYTELASGRFSNFCSDLSMSSLTCDTNVVNYLRYDSTLLSDAAAKAANKAAMVAPEPATATLSLLALAGLAARRRRK